MTAGGTFGKRIQSLVGWRVPLLLGQPENLKEGLAPVTISDLLNEAPRSRFHHRAVLISGMGFFTDAYDLFVIGTVAAIVTTQWRLEHHRGELGDRRGSAGCLRRSVRVRQDR